ncbi:hypothetical protein QQS21_006312 [Conoideocrella luteorostrata]|uniref:Rhodopsin domain-containing protein n=1 Tax=Conoideocrella luteorostrata TaxID=1105319 RepID=A0AAJ0CN86_9HYPO|nr:hypothetical protein QQS21_006312 [Conoideocrella luteorostrata]
MQSQSQQATTLAIHWVFSCLAIIVMLVRLIGRKITREIYNQGDYFTIAAIVCALARVALIHVVLIWGTSNVPNGYRLHHVFSDTEIYQRQIGSKLSIANRFFYNSYLWLQKMVLLDLYRRLLLDLAYEKWIIRGYLFVFFATYVVCQVLTFSECRPFRLYWQVVPDPGECAKAPVQLIVLGILNIVTDVMLLVLPIPVVTIMKAPWRRKMQLYVLFTLGFFIIVITIIRLPINSTNIDSQVSRTTWASTELLTSAIVVNATSLYGLWNKRRRGRSEVDRRRAIQTRGRNNDGQHPETIGGSNGSNGARRMQKPSARGVLTSKDIMMTDVREDDTRHSGEIVSVPMEDLDRGSPHSSQRGILPK